MPGFTDLRYLLIIFLKIFVLLGIIVCEGVKYEYLMEIDDELNGLKPGDKKARSDKLIKHYY